jgi:uncharacterized protein (DUF934 family)
MTQATVIVRDDGFHRDAWNGAICDVPGDTAPSALAGLLEEAGMVRVSFAAFNDGRGFTLARHIRALGYQGRLRASGPLLADQYAMARRAGFDEVEIPAELAARQPVDDWLFRADWRAHDYQARLRG